MTTIAGRYQLERRLGLGGMSTVHLALDLRLQRHVAVKLLAEHLAEDPTFVSRFQREALAAARLVHPNVVQVFDSGLDPESERHHIVMEYVPGQSCAELLRDRGHVGVDETTAIVVQACHGLDYAHRHGVVHRDVKPGNLLRAPDGTVKLADFGIAKATEQSSITQAGSVLGTAAYLAPEQAHGEEATPRSDLYSLGVVTYQLLTGRLPHEAASLSELVRLQQQGPPVPPHELEPDVPPTLSAAIAVAVAVHPRARYETAGAMADALEAAARGVAPPTSLLRGAAAEGTAATSVLGAPTDATEAVRVSSRVAPRQPRPARSRPREAPAAAAAPARPRDRGPGRGARLLRLATLLLLLGLLAAGVTLGVLAATDSGGFQDRQVVFDDVGSSVDALQRLVEENVE